MSEYTISMSPDGESMTLHGVSYAIPMENVDFITWKFNGETSEYWCKLHFSQKDVRLKVTIDELNHILGVWRGIQFNMNKYGDKYELGNTR
jgi:hypothetical protein